MNQETAMRSTELSLREALSLLRRRKMVILQTFVVIVLVGVVITALSKPVYRTRTRILVEGKSMTVSTVNTSDPFSGLFTPSNGYDVLTQIEVLQSEDLLNRVYKAANIPYNPLTKSEARPVALTVKQVGDTNVIEIFADSQQPLYSERLARALPDVYKLYIAGNTEDQVQNALSFAQSRLKDEMAKETQAEIALERFKKKTKLSNLDIQRSDRIQAASQAEAELRRAQQENDGAIAAYNSLVASRDSIPPLLETPTTQSNNLQRDAQKDRIATLKALRAEKMILFKANHPEVQKVEAQIAEQEARLKEMPEKITTVSKTTNLRYVKAQDLVDDAKSRVSATEKQLARAQANAESLRGRVDEFNNIERIMNELQRDIDRRAAMVTSLTQTVANMQLHDKAIHDPVVTITPAEAPEQIAPKVTRNLVLAILFGLALGIGFALLQEYLDDRVNSTDEARQIAGVPALGYVPLLAKQESRLISDARSGSTLESFRVLRSNVQFASVDMPVSSLMLTSTNPGEGKSMTACNLAIAMALDGRSVILVDADLRLPTIHEKLGLTQQPGLTNVLLGRKELEETLQTTDIPGLRILTAGSLPPNPAELLNSLAMRQLHDDLKDLADVVIFDCPPCLATADAQVMSSIVDGVLFVMQLGETKKSPMRHSIDLLNQAHARIIGVVFNKIDLSASRDDYYYSFDSYYTNGNGNGNGKKSRNGYLSRARSEEDSEALVPKNGSTDGDETFSGKHSKNG